MSKFLTLIQSLSPALDEIEAEVHALIENNVDSSPKEIAELYGKRIRNKYTSVGVVSALPSVIPGLGTFGQIVIEGTTITGDLALMLRWMSSLCCGIGTIYGRDMSHSFNQDFIMILGIWCGVIHAAKEASIRVGTKVAVAQFNRRVPGKIFQKINQRVGRTILTKYGTKRGGIAVGKLIPFGVGAAIAGGFNYSTMSSFIKAAIKFYTSGSFHFED